MREKSLKDVPPDTPVEIWFQDEARVGQKNGHVYQWATKGTRPRQMADQRYENAYIFGAVCPALDKGAALVMPRANAEAMQQHLEEISQSIAAKAHGVVIMDRAGWHKSRVSYLLCMSNFVHASATKEDDDDDHFQGLIRPTS